MLREPVVKDGSYTIVNECSLPYTGRGVVQRIITDLGVHDVTPEGLALRELAPGAPPRRSATRPNQPPPGESTKCQRR